MSSTPAAPTAATAGEGNRLSHSTLFTYSAFRFADVMVMQTVGMFLRLFYVTTYAVSPLWIAAVHPVLKLYDTFTDPLIGQISDNTRSRMGRRRPYVLFGGIALGISLALIFSPKYVLFWIADPTSKQIFLAYIVLYVCYYTSHTVSVVPYYALGAELSDDYNERTRVTSWRHLIALPSVILAAGTYKLATDPRIFPSGEKPGMAVTTAVVAVLVIGLSVVTAFGTRERAELVRQRGIGFVKSMRITFRNRPFLILCAAVFFFQMAYLFTLEFQSYVLIYGVFGGSKSEFGNLFFYGTMVSVAAAFGCNFGARGLARRWGKKPAFVTFALGGLLIPLFSLFAFSEAHPSYYFLFAVASAVGITGFDIVPFSIIADVCDIDELESHRRREGVFMGVYNGVYKAGLTLSPVLSNLGLHLIGFDEQLVKQGLPQATDTVARLRLAFFAITAVIFFLAFAAAALLPMRREDVEAAQAELERRKRAGVEVGDGAASPAAAPQAAQPG